MNQKNRTITKHNFYLVENCQSLLNKKIWSIYIIPSFLISPGVRIHSSFSMNIYDLPLSMCWNSNSHSLYTERWDFGTRPQRHTTRTPCLNRKTGCLLASLQLFWTWTSQHPELSKVKLLLSMSLLSYEIWFEQPQESETK